MPTAYARQHIHATHWISRVFLVISGTLLFSGIFAIIDPRPVEGVPKLEQRGPHGASHIVTDPQSELPKVKAFPEPLPQETRAPISQKRGNRFPFLVPQGSHGAYRILNQKGIGGPLGVEYKGFPKLEQRGSHGAYRIIRD